MEFYAIAYKSQEDIYYNVESGNATDFLTEQCLLPCETLAEQVIKMELNSDFLPIKITLETLDKNGNYSWYRDDFPFWDDY